MMCCIGSNKFRSNFKIILNMFRYQSHFRQIKIHLSRDLWIELRSCGIFEKQSQNKPSLVIPLTSIVYLYVSFYLNSKQCQIFLPSLLSCYVLFYQYHPSGQAFASASEDKTARMFDIRSDQQVANYEPFNPNSGFTSCGKYQLVFIAFIFKINSYILRTALSLSGRYLFCGSDDNGIYAWDTLRTTSAGRQTFYSSHNKTINFLIATQINNFL